MISSYGIMLPLPIVATLLAFVYGLSVHRAWQSAAITLCLTLLGGWIYGAMGQFIAVIASALVIFCAFTLPEQRRQASGREILKNRRFLNLETQRVSQSAQRAARAAGGQVLDWEARRLPNP